MFTDLNLKHIYRTNKDDFVHDFIIPVLSCSETYDRGTGYFSIESLKELSSGLIPYLKNKGNIRIVTSVELDLENINILHEGIERKNSEVKKSLIDKIDSYINEEKDISLDLIITLIAAGRLEIKVAYMPYGGIYHEKIAYFKDFDGNEIWVTGSNNETYSGMKRNKESFALLTSWDNGREDIIEQCNYFESLWSNGEDDVTVLDFPEAAKQKLFSKGKVYDDVDQAIKEYEKYYSTNHQKKKKLYNYQKKAIQEFVDNKYCHFFEMATGTGKTFTAIKAVKQMSKNMNGKSLLVMVVVPQIDLQSQWQKAFKEEEIEPRLYGGNAGNKDWENEFNNSIIEYYNNNLINVGIAIYDTYFSKLNSLLNSKTNLNVLLIVDEAHELSSNQIKSLPDNIRFKLGLSATPERHSKKETNLILKYFLKDANETYKYTIDEAINNHFLCNYYYYPIIVHLENTPTEFKLYQKYTSQIGKLLNDDEPDEELIKEILQKRSVIVKKATNKIDKINQMIMGSQYDFKNSVVYCGQGKDVDAEENIIDLITKSLLKHGGYRVSQFTSKTENRDQVLEEFGNDYYDTLVAIKCFDEGVDVPKLDKIYIMASDSLKRQTVQRRGRVLRNCTNTGKETAYIYDFITLPPEGIYYETGCASLVKNELFRVYEYGRLCLNKEEIKQFISNQCSEYMVEEKFDEYEEND